MASAAYAFMRTFGMDEPMGCYDDIEAADAFVLWGSNMAEMHPILWTRVTDRRLSAPHVKVAVLSTFEHRSFDLADVPVVFKPQTDLAILNYIAHHIIESGSVDRDFVAKHTSFRLGNADIGYGLRPEHPLEQRAKNAGDPGGSQPTTFEEYAKFVSRYTRQIRHRSFPACRRASFRRSPSSTRTPRSRSCRSGRWDSTSTPAASGATSSSTTSIFSPARFPRPATAHFH